MAKHGSRGLRCFREPPMAATARLPTGPKTIKRWRNPVLLSAARPVIPPPPVLPISTCSAPSPCVDLFGSPTMIVPVLGQAAVAAQPARSHLIRRSHALTQAIAQAGDLLATPAVDFGHVTSETDGGRLPGPKHARLAPRSGSSDGLTSVQTGIIVGCLVGTLVLGLFLYFCIATMRRRAAYVQYIYQNRSYTSSYYVTESGIDPQSPPPLQPQPQPNPPRPAGPSRTAWPSWKSIPPPVVPIYRAKAPSRKWTADPRSSTTYGRH